MFVVTNVMEFFSGTYAEFKRVQWPAKNQAYRLTMYVIGASLVVGLLVAGFDYLFKGILTILLTR